MDPISWLVYVLIVILIDVVAYLIMPKPDAPRSEASKDMEAPTADAGRPVPVIWGTMRVKGLNLVWYGEKIKRDYETGGGGGKK